MKRFLLIPILLIIMGIFNQLFAQCENTTAFGTATVNDDGTLTTITTCAYTSEYSTVNGILNGETYEFTCTLNADGTHKYITLRDAGVGGAVLTHGNSPLTWVASYTGTVYAHWTDDAACNSTSSCHTGTVQWTSYVPPTCPAPTGLTATNLTQTSADLGWTAGGSETLWNIKYGAPGFDPETQGTPVSGIAVNPYTLSGLTASTSYEFYVQADCGTKEVSFWAGPKAFNTLCTTVSSFSENFDAVTTPALPLCWAKVGTSGSVSTQTTNYFSAPNCLYIYSSSSSNIAMVSMPPVSNAGANTHQLKFMARANSSVGGIIEFGYLTDPTDQATFNLIQSFTMGSTTYTEFIAYPGAAPGSAQVFAFRHTGVPANSLLIDDVSWEPLPSCPAPVGLTATNITPTSADLGWTPIGSATLWNVKYGAPGFDPLTEGTLVPGIDAIPYTLSGLTALTNYEYYVQSDCGTEEESDWAGPLAFQTLGNPLSGNYTINSTIATGGTNFESFTDFADAINSGGFAGPVVVDVVIGTGPYTEQVILGELLFSSAVNTLTINGNGETLQYLSTNTNERATFKFDGTDYVTINDLVIKALGAASGEYGFAVQLMNQADYNTFNGCEFMANTTSTSTNFAAFVTSNSATLATSSGLAVSNLTVDQCTATGGYYSMVINGPTSAPYSNFNSITNNELKDFYQYGLYLRGQQNSLFEDNEISRPLRTSISTFYGIYITQDMTGSTINANRIFNLAASGTSTSTAYGFYGTSVSADPGKELLISNNLVYGFSGMNGTQYGMYLLTTNNAKVYHNTISLDNLTHPGSSLIRGIHHSGTDAVMEIINNIVSVASNSTGTKYCLYFTTNTAVITSDYNVLYMGATSGTNHTGYWDGSSYTGLGDWQVNGYDDNSSDSDPQFTNPAGGDMAPQNPAIDDMGTNLLTAVPNDFFGIARTATPDPGAIEFSPPECAPPSNLAVSNITTTTADLSWTAGGTEDTWNIKYGAPGFNPETEGTLVSGVTVNPYTLTGLSPSSSYDVYVQADCSTKDVSSWSGPASFNTECAAFNVPIVENFDATATPGLPLCWSSLAYHPTVTTHYVRTQTTTSPNSTPNHVAMYNSSTYSADAVLMLISPQIDEPLNTLRVKFFAKHGASLETLILGTMSDPTDESTFTAFATVDVTGTYTQYTYFLDTYAGTDDYIAFMHGNAVATRYIYLDDIVIEEIPGCLEPTDLTANGITDVTADLGWTENNTPPATLWDIEIGPAGFTPTGTPTHTGITANPYTMTGLTAVTSYDWYVRADCGAKEESQWSVKHTFTTECGAFIAPFNEPFTLTTIPDCWSMSGPQNWLFTNSWVGWGATGLTDHTPGGGTSFAGVDGSGTTGLTGITLLSPIIDVSAFTGPRVRFYMFNYNEDTSNPADEQSLQLDIWDGAAWQEAAFFWDFGQNFNGWQEQLVDLSGYTITGPIQLRFVVDKGAGNPFYDDMIIDDVIVENVEYGTVAGYVTEAVVTRGAIEGARVFTGPYEAFTNELGYYELIAAVGTWDVSCEADGYFTSVAEDIDVLANQTTTLDFELDYAEISVSPGSFGVTLAPGGSSTEVLTISNPGGTVDLTWEASTTLLPDLWPALALNAPGNKEVRFNPGDNETDPNPTQFPLLPGRNLFDVQAYFQTAITTPPHTQYSVATDGEYIYSAAWNSADFARYDMQGNYIASFTIAGAGSIRDLTYDGQYFYGAANNNIIFEMDFTNEVLVSSITAPTGYLIRGIAYDPDNDGFWVTANSFSGPFRLVSRAGALVQEITTTVGSISGLAYDNVTSGGPYLWAYTQPSSNNILVQVDMTTGAPIQTFDVGSTGILSDGSISGGLVSTDLLAPGLFAVMGISQNDVVWILELKSWLSVDPASGVIAPGANTPVNVGFDTDGLEEGVYEGKIIISHDGQEVAKATTDIPVTLFVLADCPKPLDLTVSNITVTSADLGWTQYGTADKWNLEWGPAGFTQGTGTPVTGTMDNPYALTGLTPGTDYEFYVQADCGGELRDVSAWAGPKAFSTPELCPAPIDLTATNFTATTADLGWTAGGIETTWNIEWGEAGFTQGEGTLIPGVIDNPYTLSGLSSNTSYDFYVQADCGGDLREVSDWAGPFTFETQMAAPVPYFEGFATTVSPDGWDITGWTIGSIRGVTGNPGNNIYKNLWSSATTGTFTTINVGPVEADMKLSFDYIAANYSSPYDPPAIGSGNYIVSISTDYGATYTDLETVVNDGVAGWRTKVYDLTTYVGEYVKIKIVGNWVSGDYDLAFDNIKVEVPPTCPAPTNLTATNITGTSADLGWTPGGSESLWNIEWGTEGFVPGTGTLITGVATNPYTLSGLSSSTSYDFYIQADCGEASREVSSWVGPYNFATLCGTIMPPFLEDFNSTPFPPLCWERYDGLLTTSSTLIPETVYWFHHWFGNVTGDPGTENSAYINVYDTRNHWLVTPSIDLGTGDTDYELTFDIALTPWTGTTPSTLGPDDYVAVVISTDDGVTWSDANVLIDWDDTDVISPTGDNIVVSLAGYTGTVKFGFYAERPSGFTPDLRFYVDNVSVDEVEPTVPENRLVDGVTLGVDDVECYDATITITVTNTVIGNGASAEFRAGENIIFGDGFVVESGAYMHAMITDVYCVLPDAIVAAEEVIIPEEIPAIPVQESFFRVFPNPTTSTFKLELLGSEEARINVEIYGMMGERVFQDVLFGGTQYEFDLSSMPKGIYFIRVLMGDETGIEKVIKQ